MKPKSITTLAALVVIGAGGFMAGRVSSTGSSASGDESSPSNRSSRASSAPYSSVAESASRKAPRPARTGREEMAGKDERLAKLESIVRGENPLERNRALLAYLDQLGPGEFEDAVAHFRSLGLTEARMGEYSLLLTAWAQADPTAALTYARENTRGGFAQDTILTTWATTDPEAAIRWAQSNHEGDGPNPYLPGIIRGLAQTDPARATELLAGLPRSGERGKGLDFMLPHLLQQGNEATREWISALSDESLKNGAMLRVAEQFAAADPAGTASWLLANPGEAAQRRIDDVYGTWAAKDSQAALSSFAALPAGEARSDALRGLIGSVASTDPKQALSLLNRYPNDVDDRVVRNFVQSSFRNDPATAASQIARVGDEREREQMYRRTLGAWMERDSAAANAWIRSNPVPDSVIERINRRQNSQ
ncbi:MAG: hypothetical protein EOP88_03295 [Verrucomicrobiaceae bacterium]|nr:MAG: hypothetical protein EOP88_03295 [Verrucomicrobiaceae bacterium]